MSNHTQRDELQARIESKAMNHHMPDDIYGVGGNPNIRHFVNQVMPLIDQYTQRLVLEARLDELDHLWVYHTEDGDYGHERDNKEQIDIRDRYAELQSQLDRLNRDRES